MLLVPGASVPAETAKLNSVAVMVMSLAASALSSVSSDDEQAATVSRLTLMSVAAAIRFRVVGTEKCFA